MALNGGADGACENWELTKDMLLEEQSPRKSPKRGTRSPGTTKLEASSSWRGPFGKIRARFLSRDFSAGLRSEGKRRFERGEYGSGAAWAVLSVRSHLTVPFT